MLTTSSTTWCTRTGACHVIHHMVYRCLPRHPPHGVPVLATSSTTWCTGARHVIHHLVHRCSPPHPPHGILVLATSSTALADLCFLSQVTSYDAVCMIHLAFAAGHCHRDGGAVLRQGPGAVRGRGLLYSIFQLNLSALYGIGGARRGCVPSVRGVLGCAGCFLLSDTAQVELRSGLV